MNLSHQLAKHFHELHFGGNWTGSNFKNLLNDINWRQATAQIRNLNTIATLVFHINYYVDAVLMVLNGGSLDAHDKFSFNCPEISSDEHWQRLLEKFWKDADNFALLVEQLPEDKIWDYLADEKYGSYYRNIHGIIEHSHYHLGQIALIKKMLQEQ